MFKKLDNLNSQTRILIAVVLALIFFIPYAYFVDPSESKIQTKTTQNEKIASKVVEKKEEVNTALATQNTNTTTEIIATIHAKNFEYKIDRLGRITQVYLKNKEYQKENSEKIALFAEGIETQNDPKTLEIRFSDALLNQKAFNTPYSANVSEITLSDEPQTLILSQKIDDIAIEKILTFYPNGYYKLEIKAPQNYSYFVSPGMHPISELDSYVFTGTIVKEEDSTISTFEDGDASGQENFKNSTILAAADRYYVTLLFLEKGFDSTILANAKENAMPFISVKGNISLEGYIGPKDYKLLESINPHLTDVVEYGIITFFAKPLFLLLSYLYNLCGNWGWAIVLLTFIIRVILYPLTYKGMVSMQKLKDLAPKMKELQQKYKGEPQKLQAHMMDLYKKHGANPMGGCLPILLQMPVFFAIYRVLYNAIELKGAEWLLWINDLSVMDPYFVLPILMGATMYLQQHLTPTTFTDPMQEKIFKFLPLIFTIFFVTFPAGLVLYWFVNNIFSILQQLLINKSLERKKAREIAEHKHEKIAK